MTNPHTGAPGDVHSTDDATSVRFERTMSASIDRVWRALTEADELSIWLDQTSLQPGAGGSVKIDFEDGPVHGTVTVWDPPHVLEYTWLIEGESTSAVRFELLTTGGATRLILAHTMLPNTMGTGYAAGWHAHLDRLDDHLSGRQVRGWDDRFEAVLEHYRNTA